ncbi:MAG: GIY-YIG nuclease family protein [Acetobacteraceae bacterium]
MFVYFLQAGDGGPVKIGFSTDLSTRISSLKTGVFEAMKVLRVVEGTRDTERWLHDRFSAVHKRGEWFHFHQDMLTVIPPDPDTLVADAVENERRDQQLAMEMRQSVILASQDLPATATTKERIARSAERLGITGRRARSLWYMSPKTAIRAHEADRIRAICRSLLAERVDRLEQQAEAARTALRRLDGRARRAHSDRQQDLLSLLVPENIENE